MQSSLQTEVILCPNCKEEVPKTLYCLNCGYPLYKEELDKSEPEADDVVIDVSADPFSVDPFSEAVEEEVTVKADEPAVPPVVVEDVEAEKEPDLMPAFEPVERLDAVELLVSEAVEVEAEPEVLPETVEEPVEPIAEEMPPVEEAAEVEAELEELPETVEEPIELPMEERIPVEEAVEVVEPVAVDEDVTEMEQEETEVIEILKEIEEVSETVAEEPIPIVAETAPVFEPDPAIRDLMENFAKNISMKIRLVSLLHNDEVKMETFERLFDSYVARGELLMNSRNETLERVRFDLDARERALNEAKIGLEELKIRKAIGDVSEEEYSAKSPGFEWDIGQYEDDVARKKAEIAYLDDLTKIMSAEEIAELREQGEENFGAIDSLADSGIISPETAHRINVTLEEARSCLNTSSYSNQ
jgi:hypothetical protein